MILKEKTSFSELMCKGNRDYEDRVKFCIDRKKRTISIDKSFHIEMEYELMDNGSELTDIYGGDIVRSEVGSVELVWEAHPNIERNRMDGTGIGREITDKNLIEELTEILREWVIL